MFNWLPEQKQWWVTGFNVNVKNPNPNVMISVGSVDFAGREELYRGLKAADVNYAGYILQAYQDYLIFDEDGHTVWILYHEGVKK